MTEPRQMQPVTFLQGNDSPVTRPDAVRHPSMGNANEDAEALSFSDYYRRRTEVVDPDLTEDQLAFRRYVKGESQTETTGQMSFPDADIPDV